MSVGSGAGADEFQVALLAVFLRIWHPNAHERSGFDAGRVGADGQRVRDLVMDRLHLDVSRALRVIHDGLQMINELPFWLRSVARFCAAFDGFFTEDKKFCGSRLK